MFTQLRINLRPTYEISRITKGGWQLAGDHGNVEQSRAVNDMIAFYDAGITTFDCADIYEGVEEMIGEFLGKLKNRRGAAAMAKVKVHTKYVPDIAQLATLSKRDVSATIDRSLQRLGLERLDLVQFHWWDYSVPGYLKAVGFLDELRRDGKIDQIGVTNFDAEHLAEICAAVDITSAQIQYSLLDQRPAGSFASVARNNNVHLLTYGSLAGGFLTDRWLGVCDPGFEFENRSLVKYRLIIEEFGGWGLFLDLLSTMRAIADRHGVGIDAIAIRSMLENSDVASVIVGARYAERILATLGVFRFSLDVDDKAKIAAVLSKAKGPEGPVFALERDRFGIHGQIMKYNLNAGDQALMGQPEKVTESSV